MKKLFLMLPLLMAMLMSGCLKENPNGETIVLMGTESDVKTINEVIPDTLLRFMEDSLHMVLPDGNMPPDIQGEYLFCPRELYFQNVNETHPSGYPNDTVFLRFGGDCTAMPTQVDVQLHPGDALIVGPDTIVLQADTTIQVMDTLYYYANGQHNQMVPVDIFEHGYDSPMAISKAVVMGRDQSFTLYFTITYQVEQSGLTYDLTRGYIVTGVVTETGIDNAILACVNISVTNIQNNSGGGVPDPDGLENRLFGYRVKSNVPGVPFGSAIRKRWY